MDAERFVATTTADMVRGNYMDSDAEARKRYLVRELERLGQHVTLQPAA